MVKELVPDTGALKPSVLSSIRFPDESGTNAKLTITDLSGKICRIIEGLEGNEYHLHRGGLDRGVYILKYQGDKNYQIRILIK